MYQRWTLREFPVYYFLSALVPLIYIYLSLYSGSLSLSLFHIYLNNFLPSFDERRTSI